MRMNRIFEKMYGVENEGELAELLKMQEEQENGDMFDETYQKLKQEQLVEQKKDNDEAAAEEAKEEESKDDKGDDSGGDDKKDDSDGEDKADEAGEDIMDLGKDDDSGGDDDKKDEEGASDKLEDLGALKMPDMESWKLKYVSEYLPIRLNDERINGRYLNLENFNIGGGYSKKLNFGLESYLEETPIEELLKISCEAHAEAAAMSMCLGDILKHLGGHNRYSFEDLYNISNEGLLTNDDGSETMLSKGLSAVGGGLKYLGELGFEYGAIAARHVGKAVVVTLDKTLKGVYAGTQALIKYMKDRPLQFKNSRALLTKAGEMAKEVKSNLSDKQTKDIKPYENEKVIDALKINGKVLPIENTKIAFEAAKSFYENFIANVTNCTKALTNIITMVKTGQGAKATGVKMFASLIFKGFVPKNLSGYTPPDGLQTLVFKDILPGDLLLSAFIPQRFEASDSSEKLQAAQELYSKTSIFLAINKGTYEKNASAKLYKEIDKVIEYIDLTKELCDYCLSCQSKLDTYNKLRDNIKSELKDYTGSIFKSEEDITLQNSLIEYFTPNLTLLDNIATKGVYVVDSYLKTHIASAIEFINDNLKDGFEVDKDAKPEESSSGGDSSDSSSEDENKEEENKDESSDENKDEGGGDDMPDSDLGGDDNKEEDKEEDKEEKKEDENKEE